MQPTVLGTQMVCTPMRKWTREITTEIWRQSQFERDKNGKVMEGRWFLRFSRAQVRSRTQLVSWPLLHLECDLWLYTFFLAKQKKKVPGYMDSSAVGIWCNVRNFRRKLDFRQKSQSLQWIIIYITTWSEIHPLHIIHTKYWEWWAAEVWTVTGLLLDYTLICQRHACMQCTASSVFYITAHGYFIYDIIQAIRWI